MRILQRYRYNLTLVNRSALFPTVIRWSKRLWFTCIFAGLVFLSYGIWFSTETDLRQGGGMALIVFPFGALASAVVGAVPYTFAKLLLSPDPERRR